MDKNKKTHGMHILKRGIFFLTGLLLAAVFLVGGIFVFEDNKKDKILQLADNGESENKKGFRGGAFSDGDPLACQDCNLIVVSLTNTRKDSLGMYRYDRDTSPNVDAFFKDSLIFENMFAPSYWTFTNGLTLFTSTFLLMRGVMT